MRRLIYFGICILSTSLFLLSGCRSDSGDSKAVKTFKKPERSPEDIAQDLYAQYEANPGNLFQEERNKLIEYAMSNGIPVVGSLSGLYYQIEEIGTGDFLKHGQWVTAHYKGMFLDGKEFDSSYSKGEPMRFRVGQLVPGLNEGMSFMKEGDTGIFLLPSRLAYGEKGFPGYVPPNTPLVFEFEILED